MMNRKTHRCGVKLPRGGVGYLEIFGGVLMRLNITLHENVFSTVSFYCIKPSITHDFFLEYYSSGV